MVLVDFLPPAPGVLLVGVRRGLPPFAPPPLRSCSILDRFLSMSLTKAFSFRLLRTNNRARAVAPTHTTTIMAKTRISTRLFPSPSSPSEAGRFAPESSSPSEPSKNVTLVDWTDDRTKSSSPSRRRSRTRTPSSWTACSAACRTLSLVGTASLLPLAESKPTLPSTSYVTVIRPSSYDTSSFRVTSRSRSLYPVLRAPILLPMMSPSTSSRLAGSMRELSCCRLRARVVAEAAV